MSTMAEFSAGNRMMRDQVLALLLSGQKSSRSVPAATTPAEAPGPAGSPSSNRRVFDPWTPGVRLGATTPAAGMQLSPVTPDPVAVSRLPTDADVRLAEITAGLVAASDKERRQTDTIRKLALQLERSELQIRSLGLPAQPPEQSSSSTSRSQRSLRSDRSARRRDDGAHREVRRERARGRHHDTHRAEDLSREVEILRREKREWLRQEKAARKEASEIIVLLADIRKNAQRVLSDRERHLRVIATLQQQLNEARSPPTPPQSQPSHSMPGTPVPVSPMPRPPSNTPPPVTMPAARSPDDRDIPYTPVLAAPSSPVSERRQALRRDTDMEKFSRTGSLPDFEKMRSLTRDITMPFQRFEEQRVDTTLSIPDTTSSDHARGGESGQASDTGDGQRAEGYRKELYNVLMENKSLSAKVIALEESVKHFEMEASQAAASGEATRTVESALPTENSRAGNRVTGSAEEEQLRSEALLKLFELDDELRVLEGVVECMEFSIDTEEAERLQQTLSTIGYDGPNTSSFGAHRESEDEDTDFTGKLERLSKRVADIRSSIALKYGKWLSDFGHQDNEDETISPPQLGMLDAHLDDDTVTLPQGALLTPYPEDTVTLTEGAVPSGLPEVDDVNLEQM